jgi:hypothetical protein
MTIAALNTDVETHDFLLLTFVITAQAGWRNTRDSVKVIPLCLAMWACPAELLQIEPLTGWLVIWKTPKWSYLQAHFFVLSAPFLPRWVESFAGHQTESGDTVRSSILVFLYFCQKGGSQAMFFISVILAWHMDICGMEILHLPICIVEYPLLWLNAYLIMNIP